MAIDPPNNVPIADPKTGYITKPWLFWLIKTLQTQLAATFAPSDADYIVGSADSQLTNERLLSSSATVTVDLATSGLARLHTTSSAGSGMALDGLDGESGPPGPPGLAGAAGLAGVGIPGLDGLDGEMGPPGPQGTAGATGAGTTGADGAMGPAAFYQGESGEDGLQGPPGPQGTPGATGADGPMGPAAFWQGEEGVEGPMGPPGPSGGGAMNVLQQIITSGSQATVDFTGISGLYSALRVMYFARDTQTSVGGSVGLRVRFNNDTTAADYTSSSRSGSQNGTAFASVSASSTKGVQVGLIPQDDATAGSTGNGEITVVGYAGTTFHKRVGAVNGEDNALTGGLVYSAWARWASTAAINRVTFATDGTAFKDGSTFTLYGIL